jgi:hypothetical protein
MMGTLSNGRRFVHSLIGKSAPKLNRWSLTGNETHWTAMNLPVWLPGWMRPVTSSTWRKREARFGDLVVNKVTAN